MRTIYLSAVLLLLLAAGCRDPYNPPLKQPNQQILVVDGYISGNTETEIRLSRTARITYPDTVYSRYELFARVSVEDEQGNKFPLTEQPDGLYEAMLYLDPAKHYRLHIFTIDGKEYLSEYVPYVSAPPIKDAGYKREGNAVNIFVNSNGGPGGNAYFRWAYSETYEYHSTYHTQWQYDRNTNTVVPRADDVYTCWKTLPSTKIITGTNAGHSGNELGNHLLNTIFANDERLDVLYSMDIVQYALDSLGFNFWEAMKKNSEDIGDIFGPQPSNVKGNIICVSDESELVLGYIGAGAVFHKRIFVPKMWDYHQNCIPIRVPLDSLNYFFKGPYRNIPFSPVVVPPMDTVAWMGASFICVDCTKKGGTNVKPAFWP